MSQQRKARRKKHVGSTHVADLLSALFAPMGIEVVATPLPDPPQKKNKPAATDGLERILKSESICT